MIFLVRRLIINIIRLYGGMGGGEGKSGFGFTVGGEGLMLMECVMN